MSKHSLPLPRVVAADRFEADAKRLRKSCLTPDDVGLAIGYWTMYPRLLAGCDWLSERQRVLARNSLHSVYDAATRAMMRVAYKIGLDSSALYECGCLVKKLYWEDARRAYCFREIDHGRWPDCMSAWQYKLPESEQVVLRNGVAVFAQLMLRWEITTAATTEEPLALNREGHAQSGPAGMMAPVLLGQAEAASSSLGVSETKEATQRPIRTGFLGGEELADALGIPDERRVAFFQQLSRKRLALGDGNWIESQNPRPNTPRYTYRVDASQLQALADDYRGQKKASYREPKSA